MLELELSEELRELGLREAAAFLARLGGEEELAGAVPLPAGPCLECGRRAWRLLGFELERCCLIVCRGCARRRTVARARTIADRPFDGREPD